MKLKRILIIAITMILFGTAVFATTGVVINTTRGLILRKEPSKSAGVITTVPNSAEVEVLAKEGEWYKVNYKGQEGYLFAEFLKVEEQITEEPITQVLGNEINQDAVMTMEMDANVYIIPTMTSTTITTLAKGAQVTIIEDVGKWAYITSDSITGWVRKARITGVLNNEVDIPEQTGQEEPTEEQPVVEEPTVEETPEVIETAEETQLTRGYINVDSANVREGPTTESKVITTLLLNTGVKILEQEGNWYKVNYQDKITGYVSKDLISATQTY